MLDLEKSDTKIVKLLRKAFSQRRTFSRLLRESAAVCCGFPIQLSVQLNTTDLLAENCGFELSVELFSQ